MLGEDTGACPRSFARMRQGHATCSGGLLGLLLALSCNARDAVESEPAPLRVATSNSLQHSGLFVELATAFSDQTNQVVQPLFVGSGQALAMGRAGKADLVLVHARPMEDAFVSDGYGVNRRDVMYSEYWIVGPPTDPAGIGGLSSAIEALVRLSHAREPFLSRGDDSGNHMREVDLWSLASVERDADWYRRLGTGMLETLTQASMLGAYALVDRPTYLVNQSHLNLKVLVQGDTRLHNPYGVIAVNPIRLSGTNYAAAIAFLDFLTSSTAQAIIADFGRAEYGASLFSPAGGAKDQD